MQGDVAATRHDVRGIKGDFPALRGHALVTQQDTANIYVTPARYEVRRERIERRLELNELQPV